MGKKKAKTTEFKKGGDADGDDEEKPEKTGEKGEKGGDKKGKKPKKGKGEKKPSKEQVIGFLMELVKEGELTEEELKEEFGGDDEDKEGRLAKTEFLKEEGEEKKK